MTIFRSEDTLVGLVALGVVPWIAWTLHRGIREGRLPIVRSHVHRSERPSAFLSLFAIYLVTAFGMAFVAFDLLFGFDARMWL